MKNEFEHRPYISVLLILLAFVMLSVGWILIMSIGLFYYYQKEKISEYLYNVGVSLDYLAAAIIFNVRGNTISAIVYKREYWRAVWLVNWLFRDSEHCRSSFIKEFGGKQ